MTLKLGTWRFFIHGHTDSPILCDIDAYCFGCWWVVLVFRRGAPFLYRRNPDSSSYRVSWLRPGKRGAA